MLVETTEFHMIVPVWNQLDCRSRSHLYEKSETSVLNFSVDLDQSSYVAIFCWFAEAHAKFIVHI